MEKPRSVEISNFVPILKSTEGMFKAFSRSEALCQNHKWDNIYGGREKSPSFVIGCMNLNQSDFVVHKGPKKSEIVKNLNWSLVIQILKLGILNEPEIKSKAQINISLL